MPLGFGNPDDVDFHLNNLRTEEDMWNRQVAQHNDFGFNDGQNFGIPINGDKILEQAGNDKATKTVLDMYNALGAK